MIVPPELEQRIFAAMKRQRQLPLEIVCCWCVPHHIVQVGVQPTSHTACPLAVAKFESGVR